MLCSALPAECTPSVGIHPPIRIERSAVITLRVGLHARRRRHTLMMRTHLQAQIHNDHECGLRCLLSSAGSEGKGSGGDQCTQATLTARRGSQHAGGVGYIPFGWGPRAATRLTKDEVAVASAVATRLSTVQREQHLCLSGGAFGRLRFLASSIHLWVSELSPTVPGPCAVRLVDALRHHAGAHRRRGPSLGSTRHRRCRRALLSCALPCAHGSFVAAPGQSSPSQA